jgi:Uma2 family endonuclease
MTAALVSPPDAQTTDAMAMFLNPPDENIYELVDGALVEKNVSFISSYVAAQVINKLIDAAKVGAQGYTASEPHILCFPWRSRHGRRPDVAFWRKDRLAILSHKPPAVPPNLVVEVVSPTDLFGDVERKIEEYLRAGVDRVWIVNSDTRTVREHGTDGTLRLHHADTKLTAAPVVTGFSVRVADLFPPPDVTEPLEPLPPDA